MFCPNCGNQLPDNAAVCPYCRAQLQRPTPVQTPASKTILPGFALGFGIPAAILGYFGLIIFTFHRTLAASLPIVLAIALGLAAVICGSIGLKRSIRTGGRKNVAGIILSAIGIAGGVLAHFFSILGLIIGSMIGRY